jgi:hypothetical protein
METFDTSRNFAQIYGGILEQQRMLSQTNGRSTAQQVLSPSSSQHLHYQPTQPYLPHPGSPSNPLKLPCAGVAPRKYRNMPQTFYHRSSTLALPLSSRVIPSEYASPKSLPV